jgi:uncharacterized membrane protein YfcA
MLTIILGVVIGLLMGLTGAGGGILAVPLLVFFLNLSVAEATPIGLLAIAAAASIGAIVGLRSGLVRYRAALLMAVIGVLVSPIGIWLAHKIDNRILIVIFSIILLFVAYKTVRNQNAEVLSEVKNSRPCTLNNQTGRFVWTSRCSVSIILSGAIAGFLSGLVGVGGGFVIVPALQRLSVLTMQSVVATSLAVIAIVSITIVATHSVSGNMNWMMAGPFCLGAISGMIFSRLVTGKLDAKYLKNGFAVLAVIVMLMMLSKVFI